MEKKVFPHGIYGITAEEFSRGRSNIEVVREMVRGGVSIVQYREKSGKSEIEKFMECREIRKITADAGVVFIVNDFLDLALAAGADGVHVGQDDLPLPVVRKLAGNLMIGVSAYTPEQAGQAVLEGADYLGIGPVYRTATKKDVCAPVGLEQLDWVVKNLPEIPFVAIGGIKESNIRDVVRHGAKTVALVTEITEADDIAGTVARLRSYL